MIEAHLPYLPTPLSIHLILCPSLLHQRLPPPPPSHTMASTLALRTAARRAVAASLRRPNLAAPAAGLKTLLTPAAGPSRPVRFFSSASRRRPPRCSGQASERVPGHRETGSRASADTHPLRPLTPYRPSPRLLLPSCEFCHVLRPCCRALPSPLLPWRPPIDLNCARGWAEVGKTRG